MFCDQHKDELSAVYNYVRNACIIASAHVPKTSLHSNKVTPGWNDNARKLREDTLCWHHFWNINGRPKDGHIAEMHRVTRARYHREIRHLKKNAVKVKMQKMSDAIKSDKTRDFWSEIRKLKVYNTVMSNSIDGCNDNDDIIHQCAPIGCTRQEVGSLYSLETTSHSLPKTYLRLLIHTTYNFKWSRYTLTTLNISQ